MWGSTVDIDREPNRQALGCSRTCGNQPQGQLRGGDDCGDSFV